MCSSDWWTGSPASGTGAAASDWPRGARSAVCNNAAPLRRVDLVVAEHGVDALPQSALLRQRHQQPHRLVRDPVFRVVYIQSRGFRGEAVAPIRIFRKKFAKMPPANVPIVRL